MGRDKTKVPATGRKIAHLPEQWQTGEIIKKEKLSKPIKDFLEETKKEQEILDIGLKMSRQHKKERTESEKLQDELEPILDDS
tara:strand:+ start:665 stop:913 length:249 start_codon:yes stop_codon:yes gene_type:complete